MVKKIIVLIIFLLPFKFFSQDYSNLWEGHFSYLNIKDVSQGNNKVFAAAENSVFVYDVVSEEIKTISTINGLSGETISTIYYSETFGLLLIGYENGLIEIVSDSSEDVLTVIDIVEKPTIPPTDKKINHFNEYEDVVYIATDYGISVYNLNNLEFGDTYYIGNLGAQTSINQTTIYNGFIYASGINGLKKALVDSNNLIDYNEWQSITASNTFGIQSVNNKLFVVLPNRRIFELINDSFTLLNTYSSNIVDVRRVLDNLVVTTIQGVFIYDENYIEEFNIIPPSGSNLDFTSATFLNSNEFYIGSSANINLGITGSGLLKTSINDLSLFEEIYPQGPLLNSPFSIEAGQNDLWVTYGDYTISYNPSPLRNRGISHLMEEDWINIPYDSVFGARNLNKISINPNNSEQVFISSFHNGLLEVNDNDPTILYDNNNSGLESLIGSNPNYVSIRVSGSNFDENGTLWCVTSLVENVLKSYNPSNSQWQNYNFMGFLQDPFDTLGYGDLVIDENGNKWIAAYDLGVIGVKTDSGTPIINKVVGEEDEGNLPSNYISALQVDQNNQIWIGTSLGLRVIYNPESVFTDPNPRAEEIIILDDGIPNELLYQQFVSDIEVDGSNNKWIGTFATGIFYLSENGQETIFHFTKDNSPLPSNNINDISIDSANGKVYIATDKGLVAFKAGGSKPKTDLQNAFVYPNPVRPSFSINEERVKIKDISENVNIKITDIEGNLVAEAQSNTNLRYKGYNLEIDGGTAFWNGKNLANNTVASGVYLVFLSDLDTLESKVIKLMVIR